LIHLFSTYVDNRLDPAIIMDTCKQYEDRVQIPGYPMILLQNQFFLSYSFYSFYILKINS